MIERIVHFFEALLLNLGQTTLIVHVNTLKLIKMKFFYRKAACVL